ncbi:MAG: flippase [Candidatus Krumholzibacteriia bacterium]
MWTIKSSNRKGEEIPLDDDSPEIQQTELKRVAKGAAVSFVGKVSEGGFQFFYTLILAKILGADAFGLFMLGLIIINLTSIIGRFGFDFVAVKYVSLYQGVGNDARIKGIIVRSFRYALITSVLFGVALFATSDVLLARVFQKPELGRVIRWMSVSLVFWSIMIVALASTQGLKIMKYRVYGQHVFWPVVNISLVAVFFFAGFTLYGVVAAHVLSVAAASILSVYFLLRAFPGMKSVNAVYGDRMTLIRFSVPLLLVSVVNLLMRRTDSLLLGYFRSSAEVGVFNVAMNVAVITSVVLVSFNAIFAPMISDLYNRGETKTLEGLYKTVTRWVWTISCPAFLLVLLLSREILSVFGPEFVAGWAVLITLSCAQMLNAGVGSVSMMLVMSGRQKIVMYNTIGMSLANIVLNLLLIPRYGIMGAALASGVSIVALNLIMLFEVYGHLGIHPYSRRFVGPIVFGAIAYCAVLIADRIVFVDLGGLQKLLIYIPAFAAVFMGLLLAWGIGDEDKMIINTIRTNLKKIRA